MNITWIRLSNFRSWAELELDVAPGVTLLSGPNGAGKSSLIEACLFAMYGAPSDAGAYIRRGTDRAAVEIHVQTEDGALVIERSVQRSGNSAKVGLQVWHKWEADHSTMDTLTAATVTETQQLLESLLGVSRDVLLASAFSTQFGGAAFTEAPPRDRKRVLTAALPSLELWQPLADAALSEKKAATEAATIARAKLESLGDASARREEARERVDQAGSAFADAQADEAIAIANAEELAQQAESAREARRQHAAAAEAQQRAQADHARATAERATADEALARAKTAAANAPSVWDAEAELRRTEAELEAAEHAHEVAERVERSHCEQMAEAQRMLAAAQQERDRADADHQRLSQRLAHAQSNACPECGQGLVTPEARAIVDRLSNEHAVAERALIDGNNDMTTWRNREHYLLKYTPAASFETFPALVAARSDAEAARAKLTEAQTIASLAGTVEAAQQRARDALDREAETAAALREGSAKLAGTPPTDDAVEAKHQAAIAALASARATHTIAAADLARAEATAQQAERDAAEETTARERLEAAEREATIAGMLAAGFGPNGVPALVIDNALGQLTETWNRVLAQVGARQRIDLRSQRLLKSADRLADTLDIVILDTPHDAPYESLSGGERTRVAIAGRIALTEMLASKRGARVRMMVLDEPAGLDQEGSEQLASVLNEFVTSGLLDVVLLVTHSEALADLIENVVRIEKTPGGESRLVGSAARRADLIVAQNSAGQGAAGSIPTSVEEASRV